MGVALLFFVGTLDSLAVPADTSHAAELQSQVAEATSHAAESPWTVSASTTVYFGHTIDVYAVPDITVEYNALHVEGRYNYEALHDTSVFLGWHFVFGDDKAGLDVTPMAGYVTGGTNGPAPAILLDARLGRFQLSNECEYVFPKDEAGFFYDRSDLIYSFSASMFAGLVGEHTLSASEREFVTGLLVGASSSRFEATFYLFSPGQEEMKGALEFELAY